MAREAAAATAEEAEEDQDYAESAVDEQEDDANRDKRFSPFGGSVEGHAGAGGGSGNFLFDFIRVRAPYLM